MRTRQVALGLLLALPLATRMASSQQTDLPPRGEERS